MKQLGHLAITVANHPKVLMQIYAEDVSVHIRKNTERKILSCNVRDDNYISAIIKHINQYSANT